MDIAEMKEQKVSELVESLDNSIVSKDYPTNHLNLSFSIV